MELTIKKLTLHVPACNLRVDVSSTGAGSIVRALQPYLTPHDICETLQSERNWSITEESGLSADLIYILDCVGHGWVGANKIQAIKLVKKVFNCGLKEAKDAVEEYLNGL